MKDLSLRIAFLLFTTIQLVSALQFPLSAEEAYYWTWSQQLSLGFWDHPPMVAYGIALGSIFFGKTVLAVRFVGILFYSISSYALSTSSKTPLLCYLLLATLPMLGQVGMEAHPDSYFMSFGCLTLLCLNKKWWNILPLPLAGMLLSTLSGWIFWSLCLLTPFLYKERKKVLFSMMISVLLSTPFLYWTLSHEAFPMGLGAAQSPEGFLLELFNTVYLLGVVVVAPFLLPKLCSEKIIWSMCLTGFLFCISPWIPTGFLAPGFGIAGSLYLIQRFPPRLSGTLLGINLFLFFFFKAQLHFQIFPTSIQPAHRFHGGKLLADAVSAWDIENVWTASPYDAAWIRFYSEKKAHTRAQFGTESQFDLWVKTLPEKGIFVQDQSSFLQMPGYALHSPQNIASYAEGYEEGRFIETNIWKTVLFTRVEEN